MFKNLKKELGNNKNHKTIDYTEIPEIFWIEDKDLHREEFTKKNGNCCFNHRIGLPLGKIWPFKKMPILGYEMDIVHNIEEHKNYLLVKARGIGATELILRLILYWAVRNEIDNRKFLIITGIRKDLAQEYIRRILYLCKKIPNVKSRSQNRIVINRSEIIALPANADSIRGYENVGAIFADEAAHWNLRNDEPVLEAIEPHRTKSDAHIIIVSTPNGRRGFFANIAHDLESRYYIEFKPWTVSEGLLIDREEVEKIKKDDPYRFEQEFNCQFISTRYAAIPQETIKIAEAMAEDYALEDFGFE